MRKNKAKQQAILDIQADLAKEGKCFLAFRKKLNPVMGSLISDHIRAQQQKAVCVSSWTDKTKEQ